ncbi:MAG: hypothetical protein F4Y02_17655 [Chloroflexi bacterium]|nr:hypothetical protein [Chloroflexota bacterium]
MSTLAEISHACGHPPQGNILPGRPKFRGLMTRARAVWNGPLPGRVQGIQLDPLRLEISGQPPVRLLRALQLPLGCAQVAQYWQLRPERRQVAVYHWRLGWQPLPALPAGVSLPGGEHPCFRALVDLDTHSVTSWRVYVEEWAEGIVARAWPDLCDSGPTPPGCARAWALDYGAELLVEAVRRYDYPLASRTGAMIAHSALRLATLGVAS